MARKPFSGSYRITQRFGANPASYSKFGMLGHNGIDWALPNDVVIESPVKGQVIEAAYDAGGYGYYVVVREEGTGNEWIIGHMRPGLSVKFGQQVALGQRLGLSDNTGNSTGSHGHVGLRLFGYARNNGYLGYTNPRPYLEGLPPYRVCLQAGHYPNGGGAPGEAEWTWKFVHALAPKLNAIGIETVIVGDFYNKQVPVEVTGDYDLFYSAHYDASVYGPTEGQNVGCFVDYGAGESEVWEAQRFNDLWESMYPKALGIPHKERANPNTDYYYGFTPLSGPTPGIVAEHGCGSILGFWEKGVWRPAGGDRKVLHDQLDLVATVVASVFARYFSLHATPQPEPEPTDEYRLERWGAFGMDQDNCIEFVLKPLWGMGGQVIIPNGGMTKAVADLYLAGLFFGRPISGEVPMPQRSDGVNGVQQFFEHGQVVYWLDGKAEHIGGLKVEAKATN